MRCFVRWPCCAYACAGRAAFSGEMPARRASHAGEASCLQTSAWIQRDMRSVARDNTRGNVGPTQRWHRLHECLSSHTHATNPWGRAECGHAWASATGAVGWTAFVSVPRRVASGDSVVTQKNMPRVCTDTGRRHSIVDKGPPRRCRRVGASERHPVRHMRVCCKRIDQCDVKHATGGLF